VPAGSGIAVPELYIGKPSTAALPQPVRRLVGYESVAIPAGRTVQVSFPLDDRSFATWGSTGWVVPPGCWCGAPLGCRRTRRRRARRPAPSFTG
jgi:hypothetical protein